MTFEGLRSYAQAVNDLSGIARARLGEVVGEALRTEVERAGGVVGLAGGGEVARLRRTVERLERRVAALEEAAGTGPGSRSERPARRPSAARARSGGPRSTRPGVRSSPPPVPPLPGTDAGGAPGAGPGAGGPGAGGPVEPATPGAVHRPVRRPPAVAAAAEEVAGRTSPDDPTATGSGHAPRTGPRTGPSTGPRTSPSLGEGSDA